MAEPQKETKHLKVLLIYPQTPPSFFHYPEAMKLTGCKAPTVPLGLITVAALLPEDWELRHVDLNVRSLKEHDWNWADIIMITGMVIHSSSVSDLIMQGKARDKTVMVGGPYATSMPDEVIDAGADYVLKGEAENSIAELLDAFATGKRGIIENEKKPDMSSSPIPRFDLIRLEDYEELAIQTCRGCPHNCEFCDVVNINGRTPRYKDPDNVLQELDTLYTLGARGRVFVADDNLIGNKAHARRFLKKLIVWNQKRGQPFAFGCQASIDLGQDLEMIDLMTAANFAYVFIGIESPDEEVLTLTHKHQNVRNPLVESVNNIRNNGLGVIGSFIIGFDGEKKGTDQRLIDFVEITDLPQVMVHTLQATSATNLGIRLKREGRLLNHRSSGDSIFSKLNFIPTRPESEILEEHRRVYLHLYEPSRYLKRAYDYCLGIRPTRRAMAVAKGESPPPNVSVPRPLKTKLKDLRAFLMLAWSLGILSSCRLQFWRQLVGMLRMNPSRTTKYLTFCALGLDMFRLREVFLKEIVSAEHYRIGQAEPDSN